jgi:mono/diheme cytochrome c family protein
MRRYFLPAVFAFTVAAAVSLPSSSSTVSAAGPTAPTFNKDVLPILQQNCQECHRPGAIAPMSFMTYSDTRPYARAIARATAAKTMPPWFADPTVGHFKNAKLLTDDQIATLAAWADKGAVEGDAKDKPAPVEFVDGWTIGKPDIIVRYPHPIALPATGVIDQSNILVYAHFDHDMWVQAAQVLPGNPKAVHHMKAWIRPPGSAWMNGAPEGEMYNPPRRQAGQVGGAPEPVKVSASGIMPVQDILAKYNPGVEGQEFAVGNAAKFIAAGSDIVFEAHYTTNGTPQTDQSAVGIVLAKTPPTQRHITTTAITLQQFEIPAGAPNYELDGETTVNAPAKLVWVQPHMHYRGKDFEMSVVYPTGETVTVLKVPNYRFDWQVGYELATPLDLPKGTKIKTVSHYDNSPANKFNPDPTKNIRFGAQSWDEMNVSFVGILVDTKADPARVFGRGAAPVRAQPE